MGHLNIEIKARCANHAKIRKLLRSHKAEYQGTDHQIDTYFKIHTGRLKLREGSIENFLVFYERENVEGPKQSKVILFKSDPSSSLKEILTKTLGILIVVGKEREIYFVNNVKFHLDTVKDLGNFVEIEAIDIDGKIGREKLRRQCHDYLEFFGISDSDLISVSYSDLLLDNQIGT